MKGKLYVRFSKTRLAAQRAREFAEALFRIPGNHWHADVQFRRRKTVAELIEGGEWTELYDRRFPGRLIRRSA